MVTNLKLVDYTRRMIQERSSCPISHAISPNPNFSLKITFCSSKKSDCKFAHQFLQILHLRRNTGHHQCTLNHKKNNLNNDIHFKLIDFCLYII